MRGGTKVALIHYWLVGMRGGEKVLEELCRLFPEADIYTHAYDPASVSDTIRRHTVIQTRVGRLPFAKRLYKKYLPLMPLALEELDLSQYDLIISSEAGPAKGVIPRPDALHICYCHSPMRYIWDQYHSYKTQSGLITRSLVPYIATNLRTWDVCSAARVDSFVANSTYVAKRIMKYYRREAIVVPPPVDVRAFSSASELDDYYLWAGQLVPYKRPDIAIRAFNASGRRLVVIGEGEMLRPLKAAAKPNIEFLGNVDFQTLKHYFARCRALVFPGIEDFGIVPVEVMASGRPVIAYGAGGALDTVVNEVTGLLYEGQSPESLNEAIDVFEASGLAEQCTPACLAHSENFSVAKFGERFGTLLSTISTYTKAEPMQLR